MYTILQNIISVANFVQIAFLTEDTQTELLIFLNNKTFYIFKFSSANILSIIDTFL